MRLNTKNKNIETICVFLGILIILLLAVVFQCVDNDQIWTYGFSYNISEGLKPYKDYNMIIGPLYSLLFSLPMIIFGNYLITFKIFHIIIYSLIITFAFKKLGLKVIWLILSLIIQNRLCSYNVFTAMLVVAILLLSDSKLKYKDTFIGLLIGFIIMTKHNIGLALFVIFFLTTEQKKSLLSVFIPIIFSFLYLLFTSSLFQYLDFCILGMRDFIGNLYIEFDCLLLTILVLLYCLIRYIKTKDFKILYVLTFMVIIFPLVERGHFIVSVVPLTYYIIVQQNNHIPYKIMQMFIISGLLSLIFTNFNTEIVMDNNPYLLNSFIKGVPESFKQYSNYIEKIDGNIYMFNDFAYSLKIYNNKTTSFYDLINKGNLGKDPDKYLRELDKICSKQKCIFILDNLYFENKRPEGFQLLDSYKDYVIKNYDYIKTIPSKDRLYSNEKRINEMK